MVRPRQPYVDWVNGLDAETTGLEQSMSLEQHQSEGRVYLIEEQQQPQSADNLLESCWHQIWENELRGWDEFGDDWPTIEGLEQFLQWFDVEPQLLTFDLAKEPLMVADMESM
ncbi:MAG: hypothetical protein OQK12_09805 [Motiliproteus sp.]|nr:hypothetical protein [Motiliproteus sp.]